MKKQKKILFLGGSYFQVPAIKYARSQGYYTITCDYLPDNPGHQYADEYHNISTTDREQILKLAGELKIDGIVAYASDPAAPTAAYVGNKLNLPSNPYESINILTRKDLYRDFLKRNGFNVPMAKGVATLQEAQCIFSEFHGPVMVKPVDSSGSKGVSKISDVQLLSDAFNYAMSFSRVKRVVLEDFIDRKGPQIHGDGFIFDSKLVFDCLGDHHFNNINHFVPISTTFPTEISKKQIRLINYEIQKLVDKLNLKSGAINIEVILNKKKEIYLMEIGPRNGGNLVPQAIKYSTGFDAIKNTVNVAMGIPIDTCEDSYKEDYSAYYVIHSERDGIFQSIDINDKLKCKILEQHVFKSSGDEVKKFNGSNCTIGILLLKFESNHEMNYMIENMNDYLKVTIG